ncbi:tumor necrosis factor receptor superfamily member 14 isoform X3 [Dendrobates tinctorius]|uniref:tumor necrosis factor receptor superfamily member 14 isoform X3 n=1 Tax=Dendrobates tinctorius TaxID=92724 RepID=UPI003CC979EE
MWSAALRVEIFMVNIISACLPREYKINNICCPMCDKGSFVKAHCTKELSSSVCVICADTTYMDHPNGLTECFRCKECDSGVNLIETQKCTESSNTVCECSAGHFCVSPECDICQEHTQCQPGQYVKKPGDPVKDTECDICTEGHYSDTNNAPECSLWTKCMELGQILYKEGSATADSICKEKRSHIVAVSAFVFVVFVPLLAAITYVVKYFCISKQGVQQTVKCCITAFCAVSNCNKWTRNVTISNINEEK